MSVWVRWMRCWEVVEAMLDGDRSGHWPGYKVKDQIARQLVSHTWYIFGKFGTSGLCSTLNVKLTICKSLLPVVVEIFLGLVRTS